MRREEARARLVDAAAMLSSPAAWGGPTMGLPEPDSPAGRSRPARRPRLPGRPTPPRNPARLPLRAVGPAARLAGLRVMVVEDDDDARRINRAMLEHHGASVVTTASALEALFLLTTVRPDVLVVDLRMPGMDGFELGRRLRADPRSRHLPLVALSALGSDADYMRTFERGFDAHLTKPVDDVTLASVVRRVVRRRPR